MNLLPICLFALILSAHNTLSQEDSDDSWMSAKNSTDSNNNTSTSATTSDETTTQAATAASTTPTSTTTTSDETTAQTSTTAAAAAAADSNENSTSTTQSSTSTTTTIAPTSTTSNGTTTTTVASTTTTDASTTTTTETPKRPAACNDMSKFSLSAVENVALSSFAPNAGISIKKSQKYQFLYNVFASNNQQFGIYCSAVAISAKSLLLPAHCLYSGKTLARYEHLRLSLAHPYRLEQSYLINVNLNDPTFVGSNSLIIHPQYDINDCLMKNDLAIINFPINSFSSWTAISTKYKRGRHSKYFMIGYGRNYTNARNAWQRTFDLLESSGHKYDDNEICRVVFKDDEFCDQTILSSSLVNDQLEGYNSNPFSSYENNAQISRETAYANPLCYVESGAPLFDKTILGQPLLYGIGIGVTRNRGCDKYGLSVFASIPYFYDWINANYIS